MTPSDDELGAILSRHWGLRGEALSSSARGTNNLTRVVGIDRPVAVLGVYRNLDRGRVLAEHRLLTRLSRAGLPFRVPRPRPTDSGDTLVDTDWGAIGVSDWIDGERPDLDHPPVRGAVGRAAGQLSRALADVPGADAPFDWLGPDLERATIDPALPDDLAAAGLPAGQVDWLRQRTGPPARPDGLPRHVIHGDLAASNLLSDPTSVITGVLDFEVAGRDLRINDLAILLFQSGVLDPPDWPQRTAGLIAGYAESIMPEPAELMIIPAQITARAAGTVGWRATRWRAGLDTVAEVGDRIIEARRTERWLERHGPQLLDLLSAAFV